MFFVPIVGMATIVLIAVVAAVLLKSRRGKNPDVMELFPSLRPADPEQEAELRQNLRVKFQHQEDKVDAAIAFERAREPSATTAALMQAAIERWERENR